MTYHKAQFSRQPHFLYGTTTKAHGDMKTPADRQIFFASQRIPEERMLFLNQVHGNKIIQVHTEADFARLHALPPQEADGWICSLKNCGVAVSTSDCAPLFIIDHNNGVFALAHCGWRGTAAKLGYKLAKTLLSEAQSGSIEAFIGPHIQSCCFEVGQEVAAQFSPAVVSRKGGKIYVSIAGEITGQLLEAGMNLENIRVSPACTSCLKNDFFSYRRDKKLESLLSFIFKK